MLRNASRSTCGISTTPYNGVHKSVVGRIAARKIKVVVINAVLVLAVHEETAIDGGCRRLEVVSATQLGSQTATFTLGMDVRDWVLSAPGGRIHLSLVDLFPTCKLLVFIVVGLKLNPN